MVMNNSDTSKLKRESPKSKQLIHFMHSSIFMSMDGCPKDELKQHGILMINKHNNNLVFTMIE